MPNEAQGLEKYRGQVQTASGPASYLDTGGPGRVALFVHGVGSGSYLWRHVIGQLAGERRCVAVDLPLHGRTPAAASQDFSLPGLARFLAGFCDALGLAGIDLVANDTGGAISQVFAASQPGLLHTLTLTNCEAHDNVPPRQLRPAVLLARSGLPIWRLAPRMFGGPRGRRRFFRGGYQDVASLPDDIARGFLEPLFGTAESARQFQRLLAELRAQDLLAAEAALARLQVPTLIVWGSGDALFRPKWAYWLRDTIPGATEVVEIEGGRLFFPDERAGELTAALRRHWEAHAGANAS
ncbi:MAG: alpha/beta hydrolase [Actinobacteria bacterium]|nr:alpha/beta hydrolase [Actinomycetota bacterium]MBO0786024.1 alpha/beta hydrolase [Actinomycetota bacterium]MBO0818617.1 alpha/beta hydrolase [Actinomycetota bacterium]